MNISIESYGTHTISDYSLCVIDKETIIFPLEGELILFHIISNSIINRHRISPSLIKSIIKYNDNELLVSTEGAEVFIINSSSLQIITQWHLKMVNNVYRMTLSPNKKYIAFSTHVISNESTREIISQEDAIIIISLIENVIKVVLCEQSKNNFCCFYNPDTLEADNDLRVISFGKEEEKKGKTKAIVYSINPNNKADILNSFIIPISTDITIMKQLKEIAILGCLKRYFHVYNLIKQEIVLSIHFEGNGEIGNYDLYKSALFIPPSSRRLYQIDYVQLANINSQNKSNAYIEMYQDNAKNNNSCIKEVLKDKPGIKSLNWSLTIINKTVIVANEGGLYGISLINLGDFLYYNNNQLSMSGCGLSINPNSHNIAMGDLGGYITHYQNKNHKIQKELLTDEMIRSIEYNEFQDEVLIGVMSGKIYRYNNQLNILRLLSNNFNEETVTCLRVYLIKNKILLLFSTIRGEIFIFSYIEIRDDYEFLSKFIAHSPQENNTNILFGSLNIKAEIWSFTAYPQSELNNNDKFVLASASEDQTVKIWSIPYSFDDNKIVNTKIIKDNTLAVTCLDWKRMKINSHREILLSCSDDKTINGYDSLNSFIHFFKIDIGKMLYGFFTLTYLSLEENSSRFAIGTQIGYLIIYSFDTMDYLFIEKTHYGGIEGLSWKGNTISTCGNDNVFNIYTLL